MAVICIGIWVRKLLYQGMDFSRAHVNGAHDRSVSAVLTFHWFMWYIISKSKQWLPFVCFVVQCEISEIQWEFPERAVFGNVFNDLNDCILFCCRNLKSIRTQWSAWHTWHVQAEGCGWRSLRVPPFVFSILKHWSFCRKSTSQHAQHC